MRLALLGLALPLFTLPLAAQTFSHVSESSTTLAATFSRRERAEESKATERSDGDYNVRYDISTVRFGNADLLDILVFRGVIPEKKGWALVAVWADWDNSGVSTHRFFVRKKISGGYDTRLVANPSDPFDVYLNLDLIEPYAAKTVKFEGDELISGTDQFKAFSSVFLTTDPRVPATTDDKDRSTAASTSDGMMAGSGRYVRPSTAPAAFYLPNTLSFTGYSIAADGDVVTLGLRLRKSSAVPSTRYEEFMGTNPSRGVDAVAVPPPAP